MTLIKNDQLDFANQSTSSWLSGNSKPLLHYSAPKAVPPHLLLPLPAANYLVLFHFAPPIHTTLDFFFLIPLPWQRRKEVQALLSNKPSSHFIEAWKATSIIWFSLGRRDKKKKKNCQKKNGKRHMAPSGLASYQNCVLLLAIT